MHEQFHISNIIVTSSKLATGFQFTTLNKTVLPASQLI